MYQVAVCDESEYGKRLMKYMESHAGPSYRIHCFSDVSSFLSWEEKADIYLVDESFLEKMDTQFSKDKNVILLSNDYREGGFCKFRAPRELIGIMEEVSHKGKEKKASHQKEVIEPMEESKTCVIPEKTGKVTLTGIFMPVHVNQIDEVIRKNQTGRSLIISMEDLNYMDIRHPNASDLCYYIHIREENIFERIQGIIQHHNEADWIRNPDIFFDLSELKIEDFLWFFERAETQEDYDCVIFCLGLSAVSEPELFHLFHQLILIDIEGYPALNHLIAQIRELISKGGHICGENLKVITISNTM